MSGRWSVALGSFLCAALLAVGCGGGGGGGSSTPFAGAWFLLRTDVPKFCGDIVEVGVPLTFSTSGSEVTLTTPLATLVGAVTGTTATIPGNVVLFDPGLNRYVVYSSFLFERTGDVIVGTATVRESDDPSGVPALCEDVAHLKAVPEMRLISTNLDDATNVALNQPLILTFNQDVDPSSIRPDTVSVTGAPAALFEVVAVDGPRAALLPRPPSFGDFSDVGLSPSTTYVVDLTDHLDPQSIRSVEGARLATTTPRMFTTTSTLTFVEHQRPLLHLNGPSGSPPGLGDEQGCLNNAGTSLFTPPGLQSGSGPSATLLCLVNEGAPHIIPEQCVPAHDQRDVGMLSATPGFVDLSGARIYFNEPVNPSLAESYNGTTQRGINVQLWHVGDVSANPIPLSSANQIQTNAPVVVQSGASTYVVAVPQGPVPRGTYAIVVRGLTDLAGNALATDDEPNPSVGGYATIDAGLAGTVPTGYRYYFRTP